MMNKEMFTCNSDDWSTPKDIYSYFMAVAMANLMVEKLSYYFSKEVKEDGED